MRRIDNPNAPPAPPHPRELGATRFFARVVALDLECPHCGKVFTLRRVGIRRTNSAAPTTWDPRTSRFTCTGKDGCQKSYVLGVLAWTPPRGKGALALPDDHVPGPRELAQLRAEGDGWWMADGAQGTGRLDQANYAAVPPTDRPERDEEEE